MTAQAWSTPFARLSKNINVYIIVLLLLLSIAVDVVDSFLLSLLPKSHQPRQLSVSTLGAELGWEESLEALATLPHASVADYNAVLRLVSRDGQSDPACWLIDEMIERGLDPDRQSFLLALEACGRAGALEEAGYWLSVLKDFEHELDTEVYAYVLLACERARNFRQMMWTFDEMRLRDIKPSVLQYNAAIGGCVDEGEWDMALSLLKESEQRGLVLNEESFEKALTSLEEANEAVRAHELLKIMTHTGLSPGEQRLRRVLVLLEEHGEDGRAKEIRLRLPGAGLGT